MHVRKSVVRRGLVILTTAAAIASLAACSGSDSVSSAATQPTDFTEPTEPVTITYAGAAYAADQVQPILDAFHEQHPNITVKYESVPFADFNSTLATRLGNKDSSLDVFDVDMPRTDAYAARGWLTDVTAAFPGLDDSIDPASIEAATVDEKLLAMPYQTSSNLMYYNKKLLKAADITPPTADPDGRLTWEQVTQDAKTAQSAGAKYGLVFDQIDRYYQLEPLAISAGGGAGATGDGSLTPEVDNDGWVKAFSWYGSLFEDGISPRGVGTNDTSALFASGQLAYYVGGPWWADGFEAEKSLDFGVTAFPAFDGGDAATPTGGWSVGINPASKNKDAALMFLKFMGLDDGGYAQYLESVPVPPSNLEGAKAYWQKATFKDPRMAGAVDLLQYELANTAVLRLQTVGYVEFEDIIGKTYSDIINGSDAADALGSANDQLVEAWEKYQS
jgi:multiple sugar transport system substrate-binding protein